ncbi:MAG: N-acetylmuramic acid 6-phosphate etherase [Acidimicrobiales bacterium]
MLLDHNEEGALPPLPPTEARNQRTLEIDTVSTLEVLRMLNSEDASVAPAVAGVLNELASAVELAVERLNVGGTVHYFGAGTSGRLAVMDAAELMPTFGLPPGVFVAHHAGGNSALEVPAEGAEDDESLAEKEAAALGPEDVAVGVTASGTTPYVRAALSAARSAGAGVILVTANGSSPLRAVADVTVAFDTGPEAIAGSTRLKAATAQKLVLNSFSTACMIALGKTYSNLMVEMVATNSKLRRRFITILHAATGASEESCADALEAAGGELKVALMCLLSGIGPDAARKTLASSGGRLRSALDGSALDGSALDGSGRA